MTKCYDIDHELDTALSDFIEVWSDDMLHAHIGEKLTCREAEALAGLLDALCEGAGESLLDAHAYGDEVDRAHRSESVEVNRLDTLRDEMAAEQADMKREIRDGILHFARDHDLDRDFVNGLLTDYLDLDPMAEYVEATVVVEAQVRLLLDAGAHVPDALDIERRVAFELSHDGWNGDGFEVAEIRQTSVDVRNIES